MMPGDRLSVAFVETPTGPTFVSWPLHVTVVPWFRVDTSSEELVRAWSNELHDIAPFTAKAGEEANFGYKGKKQVDLIDEPTPFFEVENRVRNDLKERGAWLVDETTKRKREYRPHVTVQQGKRLRGEHSSFKCDRIYLVEQKGGYKEIVGEVPLSGNEQ